MKTWTDSESEYFWLKHLAGQLGIADTARVFTFGYNSTLISSKSTGTVSDFANNLLVGLRRERSDPEV